jgi:hypothetical protein
MKQAIMIRNRSQTTGRVRAVGKLPSTKCGYGKVKV